MPEQEAPADTPSIPARAPEPEAPKALACIHTPETATALLRAYPSAYQLTIAEAERSETSVAPPESSRGSSNTTERIEEVWSTDIVGNRLNSAPLGHIVPAGPTKSSLYVDVAICALPLLDDDKNKAFWTESNWDSVQKGMHGSKDTEAEESKIHGSKDEEAEESKSHGSKDEDAKKPKRTAKTGI